MRPWEPWGVVEDTRSGNLAGGVLAVTEPRDETRGGEGGVDSITVETISNRVRVWTKRPLKVKKRVKKSTVAC